MSFLVLVEILVRTLTFHPYFSDSPLRRVLRNMQKLLKTGGESTHGRNDAATDRQIRRESWRKGQRRVDHNENDNKSHVI